MLALHPGIPGASYPIDPAEGRDGMLFLSLSGLRKFVKEKSEAKLSAVFVAFFVLALKMPKGFGNHFVRAPPHLGHAG